MSETESKRMNILMLPWLAHGHISPFLELAKKLSERNFTIHLCSTPINLSSIKEKITQNYSHSIKLVELHLPSLPDLPPHRHTTNGLPFHLMSTLKDAFKMSEPSFSSILTALKPDLLIYDFVQPWAATAASSHQIPSILFLPSPAVFSAFALHLAKTSAEEIYPFPEIDMKDIGIARFYKIAKGSKDEESFCESVERSCGAILIKSSREIEGKYMDYFSKLSKKRVVPTGPLVQESLEEDEQDTCIFEWLDKKEKTSVVYVSFGSEYFLSKEEREEIAHGLELSKVNFIWVVRFPEGENMNVEEALPVGFLERVGERGMVVERWAPQAKILKHTSTGGFLSHCGWNSILESIKFGIPIIAMPMHIDQPFNAKLINDVEVGVELTRDDSGGFKREVIADAIKKAVIEKTGKKLSEKAREMSEKIINKEEAEMDDLVNELIQLCQK